MKTTVAALVLLLVACATPYQPMGFSGGYAQQRLGRDRFMVQVQVNGFTSAGTAYAYFVRQATYLCRWAGYTDWALEDRNSGERIDVVNGTVYTKPHIEGIVRCSVPRRAATR